MKKNIQIAWSNFIRRLESIKQRQDSVIKSFLIMVNAKKMDQVKQKINKK